jgi:hypothetical protein
MLLQVMRTLMGAVAVQCGRYFIVRWEGAANLVQSAACKCVGHNQGSLKNRYDLENRSLPI